MNKGFMALMAVLVLGGGALLLALASSSLGLSELEMSTLDAKAGQALVAADGCLDETLRRLRITPSYTVVGQNLNFGDASCIITVSGVSPKVITATSTVGNVSKVLRASVTLTGNVINQPIIWEELSN